VTPQSTGAGSGRVEPVTRLGLRVRLVRAGAALAALLICHGMRPDGLPPSPVQP
jgi:hypothetical protein